MERDGWKSVLTSWGWAHVSVGLDPGLWRLLACSGCRPHCLGHTSECLGSNREPLNQVNCTKPKLPRTSAFFQTLSHSFFTRPEDVPALWGLYSWLGGWRRISKIHCISQLHVTVMKYLGEAAWWKKEVYLAQPWTFSCISLVLV